MKAELVEAVGKVGVQTIAVIGVFWLGHSFIERLVPILDAQTKALEAIAEAYTGKEIPR